MSKEICGIKEMKEYLKISDSGLRVLIRKKEIPYFRIGNRIKFDIQEINKWIEESKKIEMESDCLF
ncbi:MAG: helix-turn-helix domain-containing protein [Lachnospiraceae bacterium]|nr:helix-turn-helix domain-containing protein [Lachnospiraceae bacterium]